MRVSLKPSTCSPTTELWRTLATRLYSVLELVLQALQLVFSRRGCMCLAHLPTSQGPFYLGNVGQTLVHAVVCKQERETMPGPCPGLCVNQRRRYTQLGTTNTHPQKSEPDHFSPPSSSLQLTRTSGLHPNSPLPQKHHKTTMGGNGESSAGT